MKASIDFIGIKEGGRLLDYACGTGLLSRVCTRTATTGHVAYVK